MIKFNKKECYITKRSLILDFIVYDYKYSPQHVRFEFDAWNSDRCKKSLTINGTKEKNFKILNYVKHELQVILWVDGIEGYIIIDRRYEHNDVFNIYFQGKSYLVKSLRRKKELDKEYQEELEKL